jgi:MYXO-CTERM domain-containing protein
VSPGLLYAAVHDLAEPLSVALVLGALLALRRSRPSVALACCAVLPLTKEQLVVVPIVLALWTRRPWFLATILPSVLWWIYARIHLGAWFTTGDTALGAPFAGWKRAVLDAGVRASGGTDEGTLIVLVALLALLALVAVAAVREHRRPPGALYLVLAAIAACLAPNATVILRDALRNTALLVSLVPFLRR